MATDTVHDFVVSVGFDNSAVVKGIKQTERMMMRLNKLQGKTASVSPQQNRTRNVKASPSAFGLPDSAQLKIANDIDTLMRKARRTLGASSEEFQRLNKRATQLKGTVSSISSKSGLVTLRNQIVRLREGVMSTTAAMRKQKLAAKGLSASLGTLSARYLGLYAVVEGGRAFLRIGTQFDSLNASLLAASGSTKAAAEDFEFIKSKSFELGVSLAAAAKGYSQIGAAAKASNFSVDETKEIFLAASEASSAFSLSAEKSKLIFSAFSQIISKGRVSQEELRQQLGDHIPGALGVAAKAMNVTGEELNKMIEKGISAKDFLPKFSAELRKSVRDSGALAASLETVNASNNRFKNSLDLGISKAFGAGLKKSIVNFLDRIADNLDTLIPAFKLFGAALASALNVVTFALDILTPILSVFMEGLGAFIKLFEDAFDLSKPSKEINGFSQVIRYLTGNILVLIGTIQGYLASIQEWAEGTEKATGWTKTFMESLGAITTAIAAWLSFKFIKAPIQFLSKIGQRLGIISGKSRSLWAIMKAGVSGFKNSGILKFLGRVSGFLGGILSRLGLVAATAVTSTAGLATAAVTGSAVAGYTAGTILNDRLEKSSVDVGFLNGVGDFIARRMAALGFEDAKRAVAVNDGVRREQFLANQTTNEVNIKIEGANANPSDIANMVSEALEESLSNNNPSLASN